MKEYSDYELNMKIRAFLDRKFTERLGQRGAVLTLPANHTRRRSWKLLASARPYAKHRMLAMHHTA